jgi:DNA-binding winged helix-turn-helix (wHTH) protein/TolB-like protein/Flp pilus assembly protein TadD
MKHDESARVRICSRAGRQETGADRVLRVGDTAEFHAGSSVLRVGHRAVRLRLQTAEVLAYLLLHPDRLVTKDELLQAVWPGVVVTENSLVQCIAEIRRQLGSANRAVIETLPRRGYWYHPPTVDEAAEPDDASGSGRVEPVLPNSPLPISRAKRSYRRSLVAVLAILIVGAGVYWEYATKPLFEGAGSLGQTSRLAVAVLPLALNAGDAGQAEFAALFEEALVKGLAGIPGVQAIARSATVDVKPALNPLRAARALNAHYVVEGSIERANGQFAVDLRLIDAATGGQQWSDRLDLSTRMLNVDPRDAAGRFAQLMKADLAEREIARLDRQSPSSFDAQDLALRAWVLWQRNNREDNAQAQALARQAIALDPERLLAWRVLAASILLDRVAAWTDDPEGALERAEVAVRRAIDISPRQPQINTILGAIMALRGRYTEALAAFDAELAFGARHDPEVHEWLGVTYVLMGSPSRAIKPLETAIWLSPRDARLSYLLRTLAIAYMHTGDLCLGREIARTSVSTPRPSPRAYETLVAVCTMYGDSACAKEALAKLLRADPGYNMAQVMTEVTSNEPAYSARRQQYLAALRTAGLPQ